MPYLSRKDVRNLVRRSAGTFTLIPTTSINQPYRHFSAAIASSSRKVPDQGSYECYVIAQLEMISVVSTQPAVSSATGCVNFALKTNDAALGVAQNCFLFFACQITEQNISKLETIIGKNEDTIKAIETVMPFSGQLKVGNQFIMVMRNSNQTGTGLTTQQITVPMHAQYCYYVDHVDLYFQSVHFFKDYYKYLPYSPGGDTFAIYANGQNDQNTLDTFVRINYIIVDKEKAHIDIANPVP